MEKMPWCDMEISFRGEQLAHFAVFVILASYQGDETPTLTFTKEIGEKLVRLFSSPIFNATEPRDVNQVEVHGFAEIERRERSFGDFLARGFVNDPEPAWMKVPCEILGFVDVEAQDALWVQFFHDDISRGVLTACRYEDHT